MLIATFSKVWFSDVIKKEHSAPLKNEKVWFLQCDFDVNLQPQNKYAGSSSNPSNL
jgi:hypothetical protein